MRTPRYLSFFLVVLLLSCSQRPEKEGKIRIFPEEKVVELGTTAQFGAFIEDREEQQVLWQVEGSPEKGTIEQSGLYHAPTELPEDPIVELRAVGLADDQIQPGEARVLLVPPGTAGLLSLSLSPQSVTLSLGEKQQFLALGLFSDNSTRDVSSLVEWSSTQEAIVDIDDDGEAEGVSVGSAFVFARLGALSAFAPVDVESELSLVSLEIEPSPAFVAPGDQTSLRAIATLFDGSTEDVTDEASWSIEDAVIASIGNTIGDKGELSGLSSGTTTVFVFLGGLSQAAVVFCSPEVDRCEDGIDNDADSLIDCEDPDCVQDEDCNQPEEICQNEPSDLRDDDQDGLIDCQDLDCTLDPVCTPGAQPIGASCDSHSDCQSLSGAQVCIEELSDEDFPNGYCSVFCDLLSPDCGPLGSCEDLGAGVGLCFDLCVIDGQNPAPQGDCRNGYQCTDFFSSGGLICYPL